MAGMDYVSCTECGVRLIYVGSMQLEDKPDLACGKCVAKLHKKIDKLKKHDRRKH